jgi:hypothetical protein
MRVIRQRSRRVVGWVQLAFIGRCEAAGSVKVSGRRKVPEMVGGYIADFVTTMVSRLRQFRSDLWCDCTLCRGKVHR